MITFPPEGKTKTNTGLHIEVVQSLEILNQYSEPWNELAISSGNHFPTMSHAWISVFLRLKMERGKPWFCLFAYDNEELVGVLPLLVSERKFLLLNYLILATPTESYTFSVEFLYKKNYGAAVIQSFIQFIRKIKPVVTGLYFTKLSSESPTFSIIEKEVKGIHYSYYPWEYGTLLKTNQHFNDYKQSLEKKFRSNLRRSRNLFEQLPGNQILIIKSDMAKPDDLELFLKVEEAGWKGRAGTAIRSKDHNRIFFEHLCEELTALKWMEWYFLIAEEKYIAGYMTIIFGRCCYVFKTGYNEEYQKCSPGSLLTEIMLEEIFAKKEIDEINFYSDFKWLNNWKLTEYTYYNLRIAFNTPVSLIITGIPMLILSRFKWIRKIYTFLLKKLTNT